MDLKAGRFRKRARLMRIKSGATVNAAGHIVESTSSEWEVFGTRWVAVESRSARESLTGDQLTQTATHLLTFRSDDVTRALTTQQRCKIGDRVFNFAEPPLDVDERRMLVEVPAIEVK